MADVPYHVVGLGDAFSAERLAAEWDALHAPVPLVFADPVMQERVRLAVEASRAAGARQANVTLASVAAKQAAYARRKRLQRRHHRFYDNDSAA